MGVSDPEMEDILSRVGPTLHPELQGEDLATLDLELE